MSTILDPQEAHDLIRAACLRRPELAYRHWPKEPHLAINMRPYTGFCYIASHAFSFLTGAEVWATDNGSHYWNKIDGEVWDLTKEQFGFEYHYKGYRVPRKKKNLPERVKELLKEVNCVHKNK